MGDSLIACEDCVYGGAVNGGDGVNDDDNDR